MRRPRADAERNRARLLQAAKAAFSDRGSATSLEEIARAAGVGIGTLYRHFPTRGALLEAVYQNEVRQLAEAARLLADRHPPVEALRQWMRLFVDYLSTKQVLVETLNSIDGDVTPLYAASGMQINAAITMLTDAAVASGDIRLDLEPMDLLRALAGIGHVSSGPDWEESAKRLVDILLTGLRQRSGEQ